MFTELINGKAPPLYTSLAVSDSLRLPVGFAEGTAVVVYTLGYAFWTAAYDFVKNLFGRDCVLI